MVEQLSQIFKALSDETRLRIINLLSMGKLCVCDIMAILNISQPKASRHLAYLKHSGLVQSQREGLWIHYALNSKIDSKTQTLIDFVSSYKKQYPILQQDTRRLKARLKEKSAVESC